MMEEPREEKTEALYCSQCREPVYDPLVCGDCGAVICRRCGTPLEKADDMGIG
jgi:formylmethanofuran dehydrogenase subunit E